MAENNKLLVVYRDMPNNALTQEVDIILTPQFYTLKKETLPIKFGFQAKRIAASIFEGMLEEEKSYEYFVFKEGDAWVFIAYCMDDILHFLQSKEIDLSSVNRLFFAEQFVQNFQTPYRVNDENVLTVIDDTVVILPGAVMEDEPISSVFDPNTRPKKALRGSGASRVLFSTKQAMALAAIFMVMGCLYIVEGSRYTGSSGTVVQTYEALIRSNPALESQYKRRSILSKYQKIDSAERAKREMIKNLGRMITKGVTLESLKLDDKGFKAYLLVKDIRTGQKITSLAKSVHFKVSKPDSELGIYLEGAL